MDDLYSAGLTQDLIETIFGVDLDDANEDGIITFNSTSNGISAGTYIIVQVTDYHPTTNECDGTVQQGNRGYDFEINLTAALSYITDQLMVYKYVVDENGDVISDDTTFYFTLTKSDDSSVNKTTSLMSGESSVFSDIEAGYYYITESASTGYIPVSLNDDGTLSQVGYVQYVQSAQKDYGVIPSVTFYNLKLDTLGAVTLKKR